MCDGSAVVLSVLLGMVFGAVLSVFIIQPIYLFPCEDSCQDESIVKIITIEGMVGGGKYLQNIQDTEGEVWILDEEAGSIDNLTIGEDYIIRFRQAILDRFPRIVHIEQAGDLCVCP